MRRALAAAVVRAGGFHAGRDPRAGQDRHAQEHHSPRGGVRTRLRTRQVGAETRGGSGHPEHSVASRELRRGFLLNRCGCFTDEYRGMRPAFESLFLGSPQGAADCGDQTRIALDMPAGMPQARIVASGHAGSGGRRAAGVETLRHRHRSGGELARMRRTRLLSEGMQRVLQIPGSTVGAGGAAPAAANRFDAGIGIAAGSKGLAGSVAATAGPRRAVAVGRVGGRRIELVRLA